MSERDPALEPFEALIGTWTTEARHPLLDADVPGEQTWEWLGQFLVLRSRNEHELFPDAICVIGATDDGPRLEYFDSRGVRRAYGIAIEDGVLRQWGEFPEFAQRYEARLDADAFSGLWQVAETPGAWKDDLAVRYRRG